MLILSKDLREYHLLSDLNHYLCDRLLGNDIIIKSNRRDGRVVDYNGLENRRTERYRGFESLSLRKQGCKSTSYVIYTLYYTPKSYLPK